MKDAICCFTGYSFFDWWTLVHWSSWIVVGANLWALRHKIDKYTSLTICLGLAYAWEIFERYGEAKRPDVWRDPESWWNAWLSDPLMCVMSFFFIWWALDNRDVRKK